MTIFSKNCHVKSVACTLMIPQNAIGFPPPLLGDKPWRVPVIASGEGWLALDRPPAIATDHDPLDPDFPSLVAALRHEHKRGKPELAPLNIASLSAVYNHDAAMGGVALIATNDMAAETFRNAYGSRLFQFSFSLLTLPLPDYRQISCDLPLARHTSEPLMLVSHKTGKRCETVFEKREDFGVCQLWEAHTVYPRYHQVRVHAMECGLKIIGESLYGEVPPLLLSQVKRGRRVPHKEITEGLCAHLSSITFPVESEQMEIETPLSGKLGTVIKRLYQALEHI